AYVHQNVAVQGHRGNVPERVAHCRQRARSHEETRQPEARLIGWRERGELVSLPQDGDGAVRKVDLFEGPGQVHGDGLPVGRVGERGLHGASDQGDHGPVRGLECLDELLTGEQRSLDLEPADYGSTVVVEGSGMTCHPPPRPSARAGEAVTAPPSMPSSAPSATITPTRLMANLRSDILAPPSWVRAGSAFAAVPAACATPAVVDRLMGIPPRVCL